MNYYKYNAKDKAGKTVSGTMQAADEFDLHARLKQEEKYLIDAKKVVNQKNTKRLKAARLADFSRNIGKLVGAGVSLVRSLKIISEDETVPEKERELYQRVLKQVRAGTSLSEALTEQGDAFPPLFINMFKSAESSGDLDETANQMAVYYEKEHRLNQKINGAMTYPKILCVMIVIVVAIIMGFVVPQFKDLFAQMEKLPATTTFLLAVSDFVIKKWYLIILFCVIAFMVYKIMMSIPKVRYYQDKLELRIPSIGKLRKVIYTARFARTLSSLYSAGIPIVSCLQIARNTIGNSYIEAQFDRVIAEVRSGGNLSEAIEKVDGFTKKVSASIMVGEETGSLDSMLISVADQMEYDSEVATSKMVAMLEPFMIVVMAVIVGFIIISVMQPMYGSYEAIANSR